MTSIHDITTAQLKQAILLREQIDILQQKLQTVMSGGGGDGVPSPFKPKGRPLGKRTISPEHRAALAAAQKARWAKTRK